MSPLTSFQHRTVTYSRLHDRRSRASGHGFGALLLMAAAFAGCAASEGDDDMQYTAPDGGAPVGAADASSEAGAWTPLDSSVGALPDGALPSFPDAGPSTGDTGVVEHVDGGMPGNPANGNQPADAKLPQVVGTCPQLTDGATVTINNVRVRLWVGDAGKKGPLVFYWHGTGGTSAETTTGLGSTIAEIKSQGGIIAAPDNSTGTGGGIDTIVWAADDFKVADQIVACAIKDKGIDPGRIHALGFSAGGLMAGTMYYRRSNYMASIVSYSGGTSPYPGNSTHQDASNKLPIMMFHGGANDTVVLNFRDQSVDLAAKAKAAGAFAIICDHGGGHRVPAAGPAAAWAFFKAHPYNVQPEPWATALPSGIPSYCKLP